MQRIFITGANRGLGLALVRHYLDQSNVRLFATTRHPDESPELNTLAGEHPNRLHVLTLDVTAPDQITATLDRIRSYVNGLDVFINNAGMKHPAHKQSLAEINPQTMQEAFHVNAIAPLMLAQASLEFLKNGVQPKLVNISSQMGAMTWQQHGGWYSYTTSKAALNMITRGLAGDLREFGIITVMLHPGWVRTDMGGPMAALSVDESARGIIQVIEQLTLRDNGRFLTWKGETHPW